VAACRRPARLPSRLRTRCWLSADDPIAASDSTIGRVLKKNILKPHHRQQWVIPPKANSAFVARWKTCWPSTRGHMIPDCPLVLRGRELKAAPRRDAACRSDETGASRPFRLRVRAQRHRQPLHDVCSARRLAPCQKSRIAHTAVNYAHVLKDLADLHCLESQDHHLLVQDNLNIHCKGSLYEAFPARRSQAIGRPLRMALHSKARQLARSGGIGTRRPFIPVPRPSQFPTKQTLIDENRRLGARPQCQPHQGQLATSRPQRTYQTQAPLPFNLTVNRATRVFPSPVLR